MEPITARELFKSYPTSLSLPKDSPYYGKKFDLTAPRKYWYDAFLLANPEFIGKNWITSPQGEVVQVTYGKNFVEYPFGYQLILGQPNVERLIVSRADAMAYNAMRGDEGTASKDTGIPDYSDFPWDRELATEEIIQRPTPFAGYMIMTAEDLQVESTDYSAALNRIESKLDLLLAK